MGNRPSIGWPDPNPGGDIGWQWPQGKRKTAMDRWDWPRFDEMWWKAGKIPILDLDLSNSSLLDRVSGRQPVTFTRASTGTFVGADGFIKTAGVDAPRFQHDPVTGRCLGLLVEEARTNLLLRSEEFDDASWTKSNSTVSLNAAVSPAGGLTADKFVANVGLSGGVLRDTTASAGTSYALSWYVKAAELTSLLLEFGVRNPAYLGHIRYFVDLAAKTIEPNSSGGGAPPTVVSATVQEIGDQWFRIAITAITPDTTVLIRSSILSGEVGDGTSGIYLWGAQLEAGSTASSYIGPTTSSAVTRAADFATVSNTGSETGSTIINIPFGTATGGSSIKLLGPTINRTVVYDAALPAAQINELAEVRDDFWRWRVLGDSFALPSFTTDGSVTVDWGDGTVETLTTAVHTFANGGGYHEIGFRLNSGTYFSPNLNNNTTYAPRVVAVGPAPVSMKLRGDTAFYGCSALKAFDSTVDVTGGTSLSYAWQGCSGLTSFPPLPDTSKVTDSSFAWNSCSSLTSFPALLDLSQVTNFQGAWNSCSSLTSFPSLNTPQATIFQGTWASSGITSFSPLLNTSQVTNFSYTWYNCSSLTSFPPLPDTSQVTTFQGAWGSCSSLTSFPPLPDTSQVTNFQGTWQACYSLNSFPPLPDTSQVTTFNNAWKDCSSLASFPANQFDTTGTLAANAFNGAFFDCALTAASIENILTSLVTNGQSGKTLSLQGGTNAGASTWTPAAVTAYDTLISRDWSITRKA